MRYVLCKGEGLPRERSSAGDGVAIIPRCVVLVDFQPVFFGLLSSTGVAEPPSRQAWEGASPYPSTDRGRADRLLATAMIPRPASESSRLMWLGVLGALAVKFLGSDQPVGLEAEGRGVADDQVIQEAETYGRRSGFHRLGQLAIVR